MEEVEVVLKKSMICPSTQIVTLVGITMLVVKWDRTVNLKRVGISLLKVTVEAFLSTLYLTCYPQSAFVLYYRYLRL